MRDTRKNRRYQAFNGDLVLIQTILLLLGLALLSIGLSGVLRARTSDNRDSPMKYPVPLPWLENRTASARDVCRIGQLYSVAGLFLGAGALLHSGPQASQDQSRVCEDLAALIQQEFEGLHAIQARVDTANPTQCSSTLTGFDERQRFRIQSELLRDPIGEAFHTTTREMTRLGMSIEPMDGLGIRAVLAIPGEATHQNPTLVFEDDRGLHRIELHSPTEDASRIANLLKRSK